MIINILNHISRYDKRQYNLKTKFIFIKDTTLTHFFKQKERANFMEPFNVSDKLINDIQLEGYFEIYTADNLCIFDYSNSKKESSKFAKMLSNYIKKILEDNPTYKVASTSSVEVLDLILVVFNQIKGKTK